jgi:hypothetical protein
MVAIFKLIHDDLNNLKLDHVHLLLSLKIIILNCGILIISEINKRPVHVDLYTLLMVGIFPLFLVFCC